MHVAKFNRCGDAPIGAGCLGGGKQVRAKLRHPIGKAYRILYEHGAFTIFVVFLTET